MANQSNPFALTDRTAEFAPADISANRAMGIISYLSWVVLVPIFVAKESPYARFHANQGLILAILETALGLVATILGSWLGSIWVVGIVFRIAAWVVRVCMIPVTVYAIIAFVGAIRGKAMEIPFINSIHILK